MVDKDKHASAMLSYLPPSVEDVPEETVSGDVRLVADDSCQTSAALDLQPSQDLDVQRKGDTPIQPLSPAIPKVTISSNINNDSPQVRSTNENAPQLQGQQYARHIVTPGGKESERIRRRNGEARDLFDEWYESSGSSMNGTLPHVHQSSFPDPMAHKSTYRKWTPEHTPYPSQVRASSHGPPPRLRFGQQMRVPVGESSPGYPPATHAPAFPYMNAQATHFQPAVFPQSRASTAEFLPQLRSQDIALPTGYELLAAKLAGGFGGSPVRPLYRRYEALNHRLLLHMQDELAELEQQLHGLDVDDTAARLYPGGVMPASRRHESTSSQDTYSLRQDILGRIGFKLYAYNQIISSFQETAVLPAPSDTEIQAYRHFLASGNALIQEETTFLDAKCDLVALGPLVNGSAHTSGGTSLTGQASQKFGSFSLARNTPLETPSPRTDRRTLTNHQANQDNQLRNLVVTILFASIVPIIAFAAIPGFVERMIVVGLLGMTSCVAGFRLGLVEILMDKCGALELMLALGGYGAIMAFMAGMVR